MDLSRDFHQPKPPPAEGGPPRSLPHGPTATSASSEQIVWRLDSANANGPIQHPTPELEHVADDRAEKTPPAAEEPRNAADPNPKPVPTGTKKNSAPGLPVGQLAAIGASPELAAALPLFAAFAGPTPSSAEPMVAFEDLLRLPVIAHYEAVFCSATGVALKVVSPAEPRQPLNLGSRENAFCALVAASPKGCEACLSLQLRAQRSAPKRRGALQISCFAGMTDVAVPVLIGDKHIATLFSGQVFRREPTERDFLLVAEMIGDRTNPYWEQRARIAYFATPVVSAERFQAIVQLLTMFAHFLADYASRHALAASNDEPAAVRSAKEYVRDHVGESITLDGVVAHVGVSRFYFCKLFKKATGMTLTEYVSRIRVEHAKALLANPALRISEIVFDAGFGSIPHFNSVFKRYAGTSPSEFRASLQTPPPPLR